MEGAWLAAGHFAAAALMLLLAGLLLWLDAGSRPVRAFVVFLVLRAGSLVVAGAGPSADLVTALALGTTAIAFHIAIAGAIAWLVATYPRRAAVWVRTLVLVATVGALATFFLARCLVFCGESGAGPLVILTRAFPLAAAAGATYLFVAARGLPEGTRRTSTRLVATGLAIESALAGGTSASVFAVGPSAWLSIATIFGALCAGISMLVGLRGIGRATSATILIAAATSAFFAARWGDIGTLVVGIWRLALPLIVAWALARHRLFDIDLKVRMVTKNASVGAVFAGVFFVATEGAAYVIGNQFGVLAGIVAVGALVPALGPLRRAAERLTEFLPGDDVAPRELSIERRRQIYHEFAIQAWGDGAMAREERLFLDQLRERLALSGDDALRLETEASLSTERT